mmetsp:Transcript_55389/g.140053  ORF Transcript_55389/g.140053 Transcript_55389/m.140053 type:complete len:124 (-) Transcript_55389:56-427(-)
MCRSCAARHLRRGKEEFSILNFVRPWSWFAACSTSSEFVARLVDRLQMVRKCPSACGDLSSMSVVMYSGEVLQKPTTCVVLGGWLGLVLGSRSISYVHFCQPPLSKLVRGPFQQTLSAPATKA